LVPVEDRGVESNYLVIGDVHVKVDGNAVSHQHDAQFMARPGRVAGLYVEDLDKQLAGAVCGETRDVVVKVPEDSSATNLRGKEIHIEVAVKDMKRLEPAEINREFLDSLGFQNEQQLRDALREQMAERINFDVSQAMRRQVTDHLLANVNVELPAKLSKRQTERVVNRRAIDLMMRGVPQERIEANLERLRTGAAEESTRELKTFFILQKVAEQQNVDVTEAELNGRIAMLAMQRGQRPEKLKQQLAKNNNLLAHLYVQMREEKAIDKILETAQIEEVEATPEEQRAARADASEGEFSSAT
jgi:trigger factor